MQPNETVIEVKFPCCKRPKIFVFKTNLETEQDRIAVAPFLNAHPLIQKWNVDKHDADKVLRIVTTELKPVEIIQLIEGQGYNCEELPD